MASNSDLVNEIRKRIEKKYKDSTEVFPDLTSIRKIDVISTGSTIMDAVMGVGGFPRGRITEVYGPFSSGKTTLAIEAAVACQQANPAAVVLFLDYEHAFAAPYAHALGLDLSPARFIYCMPEYFEQGADVAIAFVEAGLVDMVVVDSAAAMTPRVSTEEDMDKEGGGQKGTQAALMARFLDRISKLLSKGRKPAMVLINQTRAVINIGGRPQPNAPKEQSAGGNAIKFYTSIRLELEIVKREGEEGRDTKGTDQVYTQNRVRVVCVKNKLAPPYIRGQIVIEYGKGIDNLTSIAELAEAKLGIMSGAGFFKYEGEKPATTFSCRGREAFLEQLRTNPDTRDEIERKVLKHIELETAKSLGISDIKQVGSAKAIETDTMVLEGSQTGMPAQDID